MRAAGSTPRSEATKGPLASGVATRSLEPGAQRRGASGPPLVAIAERLRDELAPLRFAPPVTHVYQPLDYAWEPYRRYLERWGVQEAAPGEGRIALVGMNPGPFGMAQTGVPFGDVAMVRDWLGIEGPVGRPAREHPARPVLGFACPRSEVSGTRLWGWARDRYLRASIEAVRPRAVVGVGRFAADRAAQALAGLDLPIGTILHPSPANPGANRNWEETVEGQLAAMGLWPAR